MNNTYSIEETDLASRASAAALRNEVEDVLRSGHVVLDFKSVLSVSESYADEFFGVLIEHYSIAWVFSRLQVVGTSPEVVRTIRKAIRYRLELAERRRSRDVVLCEVKDAVRQHVAAFA
ncbi:STAS-like domain-containing protein [Xanthomonas campestris]|uniref:STAS-like domain-containing protein n=1 Tax=Xanthomonas campestris TaxID=339 RepID=UPI003D05CF4B